jgi:hypothetical protein
VRRTASSCASTRRAPAALPADTAHTRSNGEVVARRPRRLSVQPERRQDAGHRGQQARVLGGAARAQVLVGVRPEQRAPVLRVGGRPVLLAQDRARAAGRAAPPTPGAVRRGRARARRARARARSRARPPTGARAAAATATRPGAASRPEHAAARRAARRSGRGLRPAGRPRRASGA